MRDAEKDNPDGAGEISRRELLRRGLLAGAGAAAFGATLSGQKVETAAAGSAASVSLQLASQWPWGAVVDFAQPFYLSPDPDAGAGGGQSAISVGPRTGLAAPLLVVPLTVTVDLGAPPAVRLPFKVHIFATGLGLDAITVTVDVPFTKGPDDHTTSGGGGRILTKQWLAIFPVTLGPGSIDLVPSIQTSPAVLVAGSPLTVSGNFGQAPIATSLSGPDQVTLVDRVFAQADLQDFTPLGASAGSQSGFGVNTLFRLIQDATVSAKAKLLEIKSRRSAISIGDMFEMQMLNNNLGQLSEASMAVLSAVNDAITSMARNVKG